MNISETSLPIIIKFHLVNHWGGGLAALGFGPDQIRTLVAMATDSSHYGENLVSTLALPFFHCIFFILAGNKDSNKSLNGFNIRQDWTRLPLKD